MSANGTGSTAADRAAKFTDEELAYHEAGHAVIYHLLGGTISRVSINRSDPGRGVHTRGAPPLATGVTKGAGEVDARQRIAVLVAGEVALYLHSGRRSYRTRASDVASAAPIASELSGGDEMEAALIIDQAWIGASDRLGDHRTWSLVQAVADALIAHDSLDGDDFRSLVSR